MSISLLTLPLVALAQAASGSAPPAQPSDRPVFLPPPAPPPPPVAGSVWYEQQHASRERELRQKCYSEAAIALLMDRWVRARTVPPEVTAASNAAEREVAEAAYARPLDVDRLERAVRARAELRAGQTARREADSLELFRKLPAADQAIYAHDFSVLHPAQYPPQRACPSNRGRAPGS